MPATVICPACGTKYTSFDYLSKRQERCPKCRASIRPSFAEPPPVRVQQEAAPAPPPAPEPEPPRMPRPAALGCPHCNGSISQAPHLAGHLVNCPHCQGQFHMPGGQAPTLATTPASRSDFYADDDDYRPSRRRRDHRRHDDGTDGPGVIALIFGSLSVACLLMGFFTCGFTYFAALPLALVGSILGFFGRGNMRVAAVTLNFLALIPAIALAVLFATALAGSTLGPNPKSLDFEPYRVPVSP